MKRNQIIIAIAAGTITAIAIGYFGVQVFDRNVMYGISTALFGFGFGSAIGQVLLQLRARVTRLRNQ